MILNIYLEERFIEFEGNFYSMTYNDTFWQRYIEVFETINVVARVLKIDSKEQISRGYRKINNKRVHFYPIPYFHGMSQGIFKLPSLTANIMKVVKDSEKNMLRLPGLISVIAGLAAIFQNKHYAVELVGDPYEVFESGVGGKLSPFLKVIFTKLTQYIIKKSVAISYVTEYTMQQRYPANDQSYTTYYSSINLKSEIFNVKNIRKSIDPKDINILMIGSLEQRYKGFDIALQAINLLNFKESITINIVGDGIYKGELLALTKKLGLTNQVNFLGKVINEEIFRLMESTDLFLMPSRTEGLPRALIEAMAMGLPAVGSNVGGIPELLPNDMLFEKENFHELAQLIEKIVFLGDIEHISKRNFNKSKEFDSSILNERRMKFYKFLAEV